MFCKCYRFKRSFEVFALCNSVFANKKSRTHESIEREWNAGCLVNTLRLQNIQFLIKIKKIKYVPTGREIKGSRRLRLILCVSLWGLYRSFSFSFFQLGLICSKYFIRYSLPTNNLDVHLKDLLENAIKKFPGTIIIVSHTRHFIDKVATKAHDITKK